MADARTNDPRRRLVLAFHGIGSVPSRVDADEAPYWCPLDVFERLLDRIAAHRDAASDLAVEITFDDGNATDAQCALPALVQRGLAATFFPCAGLLGTSGFLRHAQLADLVAAGMSIGSHGWRHRDWRKVDDAELTREIHDARALLADAAGATVDRAAIPFGSYDRRVLAQVRRAGFTEVFTSDGGVARQGRWLVPRESYHRSWTEAGFERLLDAHVSGWVTADHWLRRIAKRWR